MRHALITAGAKGLGRKVTELLLERGYSVTVNYRSDETAVQSLQQKYAHLDERLQFVRGDVTKKEDLFALVDAALDRFGRIDFLINNAGPYIFERKKLADYTEDEWYEMIEGNLSAVFHLLKKTIPVMRKQRFGRIITYGFQGAAEAPGWLHRSAFSAAKVGLVSLTKTIALEEAEFGITANMVCPGNIVGEMKEATIAHSRLIKDAETPIGRSGTGEDIARVIAFLCEEDSDMITGAVIDVTGGVNVIHRYR
ncbi:SDR family oxidoreductase [Parageobacillus thermoglucosidasius]|uniref:3-oxoacyl-ACP reductase n=3 Tax=Anoxybacillaceae TaxID=3120669 RepID=A0AAN1D857_PARTM|nr:SDR family oxidoreductase [Parageobacillus thermoglucosidasius]KYD14064.1 3-oxoacyl-[acyl-carrier protein] reductase [Anoxybacillus flavithermus]AEH46883.1 3-oxoacyl-(acyl-carrier-protein) reductase [Parageobacillus thermoglucosidasius C56-YS93]ALF11804.1 3-ketoacyl-ACP reductase [Parageobacillus thermoglucosidasius]ANZ31888.1 3-oxoacyl-ACP reductase [Parageobacillus thermoglucosidasius]APM82622.1 3-oxoacyl-ACP reductase [Parageobacillus thermoglucosidasius]